MPSIALRYSMHSNPSLDGTEGRSSASSVDQKHVLCCSVVAVIAPMKLGRRRVHAYCR